MHTRGGGGGDCSFPRGGQKLFGHELLFSWLHENGKSRLSKERQKSKKGEELFFHDSYPRGNLFYVAAVGFARDEQTGSDETLVEVEEKHRWYF